MNSPWKVCPGIVIAESGEGRGASIEHTEVAEGLPTMRGLGVNSGGHASMVSSQGNREK